MIDWNKLIINDNQINPERMISDGATIHFEQ